MADLTKIRKDTLSVRFLRLFPAYRSLEQSLRYGKYALGINASLIQKYKIDIEALRKKKDSDAALIDSLNRYIEALEGRDAARAEMIRELKQRLKSILAKKSGAEE